MSEKKSQMSEQSENSFLGDFQNYYLEGNKVNDLSKCSSNPEKSYES